jgi:tetratricopeptide (TPR) repeat protein
MPLRRPGTSEPTQVTITAQNGIAAYHIEHYHAAERLAASATVLPILAERDAPSLVGRTDLLEQLLQLLNPGKASGPNAVVVTGAPGVGKSALAWHAARTAVRSGWFRRAALFVDLQGYDPDPANQVRPAQVFSSLLRAIGLPPDELPSTEGEAATVYHQLMSTLSEQGQAVLLVLDNAADIDQIEPFLLIRGPHRVLVASRDTFGQLASAGVLEVPVLDPDQAIALMRAEMGRRRPGDRRLVEDPDASSNLARLCGYLPLALQIVAALLADEPNHPPAELVEELNEERSRLRALSYDDRWGVRSAFDLSYFRLAEDLALLFRLLPLVPGPSISVDAAASLVNLRASEVRRQLMRLTRAHLLEKLQADRWRIHDLLRIYAWEQILPDEDVDGAFKRLLTDYQEKAKAAVHVTQPVSGQSIPPPFKSSRAVKLWLETERPALVNLVIQAAGRPTDRAAAVDLAYLLSKLLNWARHVDDQMTTAEAAVQAGRELGGVHQGVALDLLGQALVSLRRFDSAIIAHQRAFKLFRKAGDRKAEGTALTNLGVAYLHTQPNRALRASKRALKIHRRVRCQQGEAKALQIFGEALLQLGKVERANVIIQQSRAVFHEAGDIVGEAGTINDLSLVLRQMGHLDEAIAARRQALGIFRQLGDRWYQAMLLNNLGSAFQYNGQFEEAAKAHGEAARIYSQLGDRYSEAKALNNLGPALRKIDRVNEAIDAGRNAVSSYRDLGDRVAEGQALGNLAIAVFEANEINDAMELFERAVQILRGQSARYELAVALDKLGVAQMKLDRVDEARASMGEARAIFESIGKHDDASVTSIRMSLFLSQW